MTQKAGPDWFDRPVLEVATDMLGAQLVSTLGGERVVVRLTEVEAYDGAADPGSHAYRGRTTRNATMFGPPGLLYVYFTYGMHCCANLVCGPSGQARAVLLRAGEVLAGTEVARRRRYGDPTATSDDVTPAAARRRAAEHRLASGPANLAKALGLTTAQDGLDTTAPDADLWLVPPGGAPEDVRTGPRVGVSGPGGSGEDYPWRFWLGQERTVSAYRPAVKRVRRPGTR